MKPGIRIELRLESNETHIEYVKETWSHVNDTLLRCHSIEKPLGPSWTRATFVRIMEWTALASVAHGEWWTAEVQMTTLRRAFFLVSLMTFGLVAACAAPASPPTSDDTAPAPTVEPSLTPTSVPRPTPTPTPFPSPTPTPVPLAVVIGETVVEIPGTRLSLDGTFDIDPAIAGESTVGQTLTISFEVPRRTADGRTSPRGVITFGKWIIDDSQLENFIELPTVEGPFRLHLHRDGVLRTYQDEGQYT